MLILIWHSTIIAQLKKESEKEGEKGILEALSETFTVDEIAKFTHKKSEIIEILDSWLNSANQL